MAQEFQRIAGIRMNGAKRISSIRLLLSAKPSCFSWRLSSMQAWGSLVIDIETAMHVILKMAPE
jgi:hypothetical protein